MELDKAQKTMLFKFCAYGFLKNLRFFEPFLYLFFLTKGLTYTQIGVLIGVRAMTVYVLEIPTGIIADLTGRRRAMVLAFASYLLSFAVFSATSSFWLFVPAMFLFGAGEAFRSGTHKAMIMQHLDVEGLSALKVHYYGTTRSISRLGSAASVLMAGVIVYATGGYHLIFVAAIPPYVLGLLLMFTYPPELDGEVGKAAPPKAMFRHMADSFKSIRQNRELDKVVVNTAVFESFFKVAKDYLQPILKQAALAMPILAAIGVREGGKAAVLITPVYFAIYLNEFFSSRYSGRFADRIGHLGKALNGLFWAFAVSFVLVGVFLRTALLPLAVVMFFLFYTLNNLRKPVVIGFLSDTVEPQQRATVLSVQAQTVAIMQAAIAPMLGLIADHLGIHSVFLIGGFILLGAGLVLRLQSRRAVPEVAV
ncbi:MAG: MFS transporter [Candidatus Brocadiae bacterium]|nr:MFS transporter [Candidatus Brocadiia bacterium]